VTKDDYLRIARECGAIQLKAGSEIVFGLPRELPLSIMLIDFASAIAALEREECAKLCNDIAVGQNAIEQQNTLSYMNGACDCAAAIRNKDSECA
jgi:hypothetical protein